MTNVLFGRLQGTPYTIVVLRTPLEELRAAMIMLMLEYIQKEFNPENFLPCQQKTGGNFYRFEIVYRLWK